MKNIFKKTVVVSTSAVLAATTLTVLPAQAAPERQIATVSMKTTKMTPEQKRMSDRDLFMAVWFATGPGVEQLKKEVKNESFRAYLDNGSQDAEVLAIANKVADELERKNPKYLNLVSKQLVSGDVFQVEKVMKSTSEDVINIMQRLYPANQKQIKTAEASPHAVALAVVAVVAVAVWSGAVVVNYAGAVNVAGAVNAVGWFNAKTKVNVKASLPVEPADAAVKQDNVEQITADITSGLAT